jgi:acid phosphatase
MHLSGERTPVGVRMNNPPANIPEHWPLCHAGRKFPASIWNPPSNNQDSFTHSSVNIERVVEFRNGTSKPGVW